MFKSDFYAAVGIKKPYFYEILTGSPPPQDTLETIISVIEKELGPDEQRRRKLYDLAAKCRKEISADISDMIKAQPENLEAIRIVLSQLPITAGGTVRSRVGRRKKGLRLRYHSRIPRQDILKLLWF